MDFIHINDIVYVNLTKTGLEILKKMQIEPEIDEKGYTRFKLVDLLRIFADHMKASMDQAPFVEMIPDYKYLKNELESININELVYVNPTKAGEDVLTKDNRTPHLDENGFSRYQLHDLFSIFGKALENPEQKVPFTLIVPEYIYKKAMGIETDQGMGHGL